MNETLAALLLARLSAALPYLDRAVGLARTYEFTIPNGETPRRLKLPVPLAYTAADCELDPYFLVPDAGTGSILFFEDAGTVSQGAGKAHMSARWRAPCGCSSGSTPPMPATRPPNWN